MTYLTRNHLWFIALFAFSYNFCFAQPSGEFSLDFDNSTPLIDMNGNFHVDDQIIGAGGQPIPLSFDVGITHRSSGALVGSGTAIVFIGNDPVAAFYHANGRVSGGGNNPVRVFLSVSLRGQGTVGGLATNFKISPSYNLTFNQESGALEGPSRGSANLSRVG